MKKISLVFILLLPCLSFASSLVKTFDGGAARCLEGADIGNRAYKLALIDERDTTTHKHFLFRVQLFACESDFKLHRIDLNFSVKKPYLDMNNQKLSHTYSNLKETRLVGFTENGAILGSELLVQNEEGEIYVNLKIAHFESPNQILLNLKANETISNSEGLQLMQESVITSSFLLNLN